MSNSSNNTTKITFTTKIEEANDGTGDGILTFPPEVIAQTGWKEGTVLHLKVVDETLLISDTPL